MDLDVDQAKAVYEVFASVRGYRPRARDITGTYRFEIEQVGSWLVRVTAGRVAVTPGDGPADCVIACTGGDLLRIASGEQNLLTAVMQGRVRVEGDLVLAQRFHGLLPGPPPEDEVRP